MDNLFANNWADSIPIPPPPSLRGWRFGIELELVLKMKPGFTKSRTQQSGRTKGKKLSAKPRDYAILVVERDLRAQLFGLGAKLYIAGSDPEPSAYTSWTIEDDFSIQCKEDEISLELISLILTLGSDWRKMLDTIYEALQENFSFSYNTTAGTHVHVSPDMEGGWNMRDLKSLAKGVVYYDSLIDALVPPERNGNQYCEPNIFADRVFQDMSSGQPKNAFRSIDKLDNEGALCLYISPAKYYAWNFNHLMKKCRTVECRRFQQAMTSVFSQTVAIFVLSFVQASMQFDEHGLAPTYATNWMQFLDGLRLQDLQDFVATNPIFGEEIETLFEGKTYGRELTRRPSII